jgi:hypothetical protein
MSCCYTCLFERSTIAWDDLVARGSMAIPLGTDLDLESAAGGSVVVAVYSTSVDHADGAAAQLVCQAITPGRAADDEQDFVGRTIFRSELGQAQAGDAISIPLPQELGRMARVHLDVLQGDTIAAQSLELSVWLRQREEGEA